MSDKKIDRVVRPGYELLAAILDEALEQAQAGKGAERHATGADPFEDQQIVQLGEWMGGSTVFAVGQACKKAIESTRLPHERARRELLGAINYLAAAVITADRHEDVARILDKVASPPAPTPCEPVVGDRVRVSRCVIVPEAVGCFGTLRNRAAPSSTAPYYVHLDNAVNPRDRYVWCEGVTQALEVEPLPAEPAPAPDGTVTHGVGFSKAPAGRSPKTGDRVVVERCCHCDAEGLRGTILKVERDTKPHDLPFYVLLDMPTSTHGDKVWCEEVTPIHDEAAPAAPALLPAEPAPAQQAPNGRVTIDVKPCIEHGYNCPDLPECQVDCPDLPEYPVEASAAPTKPPAVLPARHARPTFALGSMVRVIHTPVAAAINCVGRLEHVGSDPNDALPYLVVLREGWVWCAEVEPVQPGD